MDRAYKNISFVPKNLFVDSGLNLSIYTEKNGDQRNMGDYWKIGQIIR